MRTENNNSPSEFPTFDFPSDDSVTDPNYVPLSGVTNVEPIDSTSVDINNDLHETSQMNLGKAEEMFRNKILRIVGQGYTGFRKTAEDTIRSWKRL